MEGVIKFHVCFMTADCSANHMSYSLIGWLDQRASEIFWKIIVLLSDNGRLSVVQCSLSIITPLSEIDVNAWRKGRKKKTKPNKTVAFLEKFAFRHSFPLSSSSQ